MSPDQIRAIAKRFFQVWNRDLSAIDELAAPELTVTYPLLIESVHGPEAYKRVLSQIHSRFPDFEFFAEEPIVDGDRAVIQWRGGGTHSAKLLGIPPTARRIEWTGISVYRIRNGKVVEERGEEDVLSILRQMGAFPVIS